MGRERESYLIPVVKIHIRVMPFLFCDGGSRIDKSDTVDEVFELEGADNSRLSLQLPLWNKRQVFLNLKRGKRFGTTFTRNAVFLT